MGSEMTFRSLWEKSYFEYLDSNSEVSKFYSESLRVPYVANKKTGRLRNYIPDLLVEYIDGSRQIIEIKPTRFLTKLANIKKFNAARLYCADNGITFVIVTEKDLKSLGLLK